MRWTSDLARPAPIVAAAVLALNDHVLKGAGVVPGWLTGKLSDVSGLFVATILGVVLVRAGVRAVTGREVARDGRLAVGVAVALAVAFAALKLSPAVNGAVEQLWGVNRLDPTDLLALPAIALAWLWLGDRERATADGERPRRFLGGLALAGIVLACAATPAPPPVPPRPVPGWTLRDATTRLACGEATAWVSKSGKTGFGLTVRVTSHGSERCVATIAAARTRFPGGDVIVGRELAIVQPAREAIEQLDRDAVRQPVLPHYHYVAFELDNNARWNRGDRTAQVEVELVVGGERSPWTMPATHAFVTFPVGAR